MLHLIIGKAGTGKTAAIIEKIRAAVERREGGHMMIVPEQYSHEAERELCGKCGDTLSRYAEVFSFTGLARRVRTLCGGGAADYLDKGGRLLCMSLALGSVGSRLKIYGAAARKSELQAMLLTAIDEMKSACVSSDSLSEAAENCGGALGEKLSDLALIYEAYEAAVANGHADPADMLTLLAGQIGESGIGKGAHVYIDGFIDFTMQEQNVILALINAGADVTVCLTVDRMDGDNEIFEISRRAGRELIAAAKANGAKYSIELSESESSKDPSLIYYGDMLFSYTGDKYEGESAISLHCAESLTAECEFAAAKALELVRDGGCRWRDIAIAARGFGDYRNVLANIFEQYGVPLFISDKSELMYKPLPLMISLAYEICAKGWEADDVISYMRTSLTGLSEDECDLLEGYIFKWQLRSSAWMRAEDWKQHPDGYRGEDNDESRERLAKINAARRKLADPLIAFQRRSFEAQTAEEQCAALAGLFADMKLPECLEKRAELLASAGQEELAQEYAQLWDITVSALEQTAAVLTDRPMDRDEFGKLFTLMLSKYDIGTIPVSLDRVSAGDFDRMRRRSIKHLIVLGASDSRIPQSGDNGGVFTDTERRRLSELDINLGADADSELWREFSLIYNCLTLPSKSLTLCYSATDGDGQALHPSFVFNRAKAIFGIEAQNVSLDDVRLSAPSPALMMAGHAMRGGNAAEQAAKEYFLRADGERCETLRKASEMARGRLSPNAVKLLYGDRLKLSASRIDKFASCKFAYFCQYGLKAEPYEPAGFKPPEIGTFMHFVLENLAKEVKEKGGFRKVDDAEIGRITDKYVDEYVHKELNDFNEKSARFIYIFKRLCRDVRAVAADMAAELRKSDFEPLDFELNFADAQKFKPIDLGDGEYSMTLTGVADRIDGWLHKGKLYLRVVDYKTGKKKFSMSDVYYGMGLQMLLYLFALQSDGEALYGQEIAPAGVMYQPARTAILSADGDIDAEEAEKKRNDELRRSGLVLDDSEVINAWENGEDKRYIPVTFKGKEATPVGVASLARLGKLSEHIKGCLKDMAAELHRGNIAADPYFKGSQESACLYCDFFDACHFSDGENGEHCRYLKKLEPEKVWQMLEGGNKNG